MQNPGFVALALCAVLGAGCSSSDPATEVRAVLAAAELAAEARDGGFFRDLIADGYGDARGNDRDQVLTLLRGYFLTHQRIEIVSRIDDVALTGDAAAHAVVHAGMAGQRAGESPFGIDGDLYRFELELSKQSGEWQVIRAAWDRALGE